MIKVVQVGLGHDHATGILNCLLKLKDTFQVLGVARPCEEDNTKYEGLTVMSFEDALNSDADAVIIETEEKYLVKYASLFAEKGFNIHMDKPGGFELAEFENFISIAKKKNIVLSMGYMYRFNPAIIDVVNKIKSGEMGEIYSVEADMSCEHSSSKRKWLNTLPGGMMFYLGCHLIDIVYNLLGAPEEIIPLNYSTMKDDVDSLDCGMAVFKYKNSTAYIKTSAAEPGGINRRRLVVCCEKGALEIKPLESYDENGLVTVSLKHTKEKSGWCAEGEITSYPSYDRYDDMMQNFAEMVRENKQNLWSYDYELDLFKTILKCCEEKKYESNTCK